MFAFVPTPFFISQVSPRTSFGVGQAKASQGDPLRFSFDVIGEPKLPKRVHLALLRPTDFTVNEPLSIISRRDLQWASMRDAGNDLFESYRTPSELGNYVPVVVAWVDDLDRLVDLAKKKLALGEQIELELFDIADLLEALARDPVLSGWPTFGISEDYDRLSAREIAQLRSEFVAEIVEALRDAATDPAERLGLLGSASAVALAHLPTRVDLACAVVGGPIWVERPLAAASSWYELFPRSFGGFKGVTAALDRIAGLGFDVLYLPPIHPIGKSSRKGKNNSLVSSRGDVGSPWAIGGRGGGHMAIEPALGTLADFDSLVARATELGMEIALDIALQCSPDHPWVSEHPEWFARRSDGSIAFAENPPKKYQDIYPINFYVEDETSAALLWTSIYEIFTYWIAHGVKVFRVDNPHTKPIDFWRWILGKLRLEYPEVVLLAEAFTFPKLMHFLGEIGFSQSYTYFTWRTGKDELGWYGQELSGEPAISTLRPNFWPNTPDILADPLRGGDPLQFAVRATLAATMASSWGIYSGYELYENQPFAPDSEEYLNSEKYEIKQRDFSRPAPLDPYLGLLNEFRRDHPCLRYQGGFRLVATDSPDVLAYLRHRPDSRDAALVIVNLKPAETAECQISTWPIRDQLGIAGSISLSDRISGETYSWEGDNAYVRLDPKVRVAHLLEIVQQS